MVEIFLSDIPDEGLRESGQFTKDIFQLDPSDSVRALPGVTYDLTIYYMDDVVVFSGSMKAEFEIQCGTCMDYFPFTADLSSFQSELDIEEDQRSFDLQQVIREDLLLTLPSAPFCEEID
ncbi:MAG: hypothetical protein AAF226_13655, partial [Verrucomicrobiota bacterium]